MALDAFIGTWKEEEKKNFDDFAAAIGLTDKTQDFYKNAKTIISYNKDGDSWIIHVRVADKPNGKEFRFKIGETYDSENLDGTPMESRITEKDGTFVETHKIDKMEYEMKIERVIEEPNTMLVKTEYDGHCMFSRYTRVCE